MKSLLKLAPIFGLIAIFFSQCTEPETTEAPETAGLSLPDGFKGELLYSPGAHEQGSWVAITTDPKGRLIVSDQYGYLYRVTVPNSDDPVKVEKIPLEIGQAQGLLWAFNSLYVSVNSHDPLDGHGSGFYRLFDTDDDDQLDSIQTLVGLEGAGEHGPHAILLGPDGNSLYFIAGNHTDVSDQFSSVLPNNWKEDRVFSAFKDPRGHANLRGAPGGWIVKTDPEGKNWEIVASGFRNAYDIAFNDAGELFTFDSDMEWDLGSPWYRPIRVCHAINGAEFGWRTGSGKWPAYYPDNLPGVVDIGQGSPTGIVMGKGAKFPQRYQEGLFIMDWSFGTMFFVEMTPDGSTYTGTKEEFLSGKPLPLADATIGADGAMYFVTGGRRIESGLYRVSYVGAESTEPANIDTNDAGSDARATRKMLEDLQKPQAGAVEKAWPYLSHEDRFIRYAARVAIENQPVDEWKEMVFEETNAVSKMQGTIALARMGDNTSRDKLAYGLLSIDGAALDEPQRLDLIRAYGLVFSRMGRPADATLGGKIKAQLPTFPSKVPALDRELCDLFAFLQEPTLVATTLDLMEETETTIEADLNTKEVLSRSEQYGPTIEAMHENRPLEQGMAYAMSLCRVKTGWTPELRKRYFQWFYRSLTKSGGESYKGFVDRVRLTALEQVPAAERATLAKLSGEALLGNTSLSYSGPQPKGPGRNWEIGEANEVLRGMEHRAFVKGEQMYNALQCGNCHSMQGKGGAIGPDLSQTGTRFSTSDILRALQTPSATISDQYGATLFTLNDGRTMNGRVIDEQDGVLHINLNPYAPSEFEAVAKEDIKEQMPSPVSLMPAGLINRLNEEELLDLMAYLKAGGNPEDEVFQ